MHHTLVDFVGYLQSAQSKSLLLYVLAACALFNALLTFGLLFRLPRRGRSHATALSLLLFGFGFFIPVVGTLGLAAALLFGIRERAGAPAERFKNVTSPQFDPLGDERTLHGAGDSRRNRLEQSVMALQNMPNLVANPILRHLLADSVDDVRMVAFGMLDSEEKKIAQRIRDLLIQLDGAETMQERVRCTRLLAELHWELAYAGMVQGDLRRYTLEQADGYVTSALTEKHDAGLVFLLARIKNAQGDHDEAERYLLRSKALGLPKSNVLPYLAELAFRRLDFAAVRVLMNKLADTPVTPRLHSIVEFWTQPHARR